MKDQRPSSMDELFSEVRDHDPVPEGTLGRVATRLEQRPRLSFSPWLPAGLVAVVLFTLWSQLPAPPKEVPLATAPAPLPTKREPLTPQAPKKSVAQPAARPDKAVSAPERRAPNSSKRRATATPKLQVPPPRLAVEPRAPRAPSPPEVERATPLPPATPGLHAPSRLASGANLAPSRTGPPRFKDRRSASRYRPRAIVEFQRVDWDSLETQTLPAHFQPIINARDRPGLLAALDALPLQKRPGLLVVRGELRAGAARCSDAMVDFSHVLSSDDRAARRRASYGRSICQDILQKTF